MHGIVFLKDTLSSKLVIILNNTFNMQVLFKIYSTCSIPFEHSFFDAPCEGKQLTIDN